MKIYEIKDKMVGEWNPEVRAMIDTWTNYFNVTLKEYQDTIFGTGINFAKANNAQAWIVDSLNAKGVFGQDIQKYIEEEVFDIFEKNG